jgi:aromatic ring-opening dioxygenase catalytic subunit (LigB family)
VAFPEADIPVVQLSLRQDLDPAAHIALGRLLAPLRDEGILIIGSGVSFHNFSKFNRQGTIPSKLFDASTRRPPFAVDGCRRCRPG